MSDQKGILGFVMFLAMVNFCWQISEYVITQNWQLLFSFVLFNVFIFSLVMVFGGKKKSEP
jgi:hypothetical protein